MSLFDSIKRLFGRSDPGEPTVEGGPDGPTFESFLEFVDDGGEHPVEGQLEALRFGAQTEALSIARASHDPELWRDGQLEIEYERALAHDHEALRDLTAVHTTRWLSNAAADLTERAAQVVATRIRLDSAQRQLDKTVRDFDRSQIDVDDDPLEAGRYYRTQSPLLRVVKAALVVVFVGTEFIMTGDVFEAARNGAGVPNLGYALAVGVMLLLIAVPHYTAKGLKEGLTRYHGHDQQYREENNLDVPPAMKRVRHHEEQDDRGFRLTAAVVGAVLLLIMFPLSILRAREIGRTPMWTIMFFLLQAGISGYFFLREWYDHGSASSDHQHVTKRLSADTKRRDSLSTSFTFEVQDFLAEGEQYHLIMHSYSRWDSYIISSFNATIRFARHIIGQHNPAIAPFVNAVDIPQLSNTGTHDADDRVLVPTTLEHPALGGDDIRGRSWLLNRLNGLAEPRQNGHEVEGALRIVTPMEILQGALVAAGCAPLSTYTAPGVSSG